MVVAYSKNGSSLKNLDVRAREWRQIHICSDLCYFSQDNWTSQHITQHTVAALCNST